MTRFVGLSKSMVDPMSKTGSESPGAEPERNWFIKAKLVAPIHEVRLVERGHLLARLDRFLAKRLGLIVAPAGFGKTTILMQWQARQRANGATVAWLTIDEGDADTHQFLSYIVLALASAGLSLGSLEAAAEQGMVGGALRPTLSLLLDRAAAHAGSVVLILDDYHRIAAPGTDRLLGD